MPLRKLGALKKHSGLLSGPRFGKSECALKDDQGLGVGLVGRWLGGGGGAEGIRVGETAIKQPAQAATFPEAP